MSFERAMRFVSIVFCTVTVVALVGVGSAARGQSCGATDAQIVSAIYADIKADKGLATQVSHINVVVVNQAVKFQGWADSKKDYDKIAAIGMGANCVRMVNVNDFLETPPAEGSPMRSVRGCAAGMKACGDVCIPEGDACNVATSARLLRFLLPDAVAWMPGGGCGQVAVQ